MNPLLQDLILYLFPNIKNDDIIHARKYGKYAKTDIVISVNNVDKGISIKSGYNNSVHIEPINKFVKKLESYGISSENIEQLKRYVYSDGTNNNTGEIRLSSNEYLLNNIDEINTLNSALECIKKELIRRFLIETDVKYLVPVDVFIHGSINDFFWVTSDEVLFYLTQSDANSNYLHVSNLYIQSWNKNLIRNNRYEHCREYIQVKWFSMYNDIIKIMSNRNLYM